MGSLKLETTTLPTTSLPVCSLVLIIDPDAEFFLLLPSVPASPNFRTAQLLKKGSLFQQSDSNRGWLGTKRKCYSCAMPSPSCNRYGDSLTKILTLNYNAGHRTLTHGQETMAWLSGFSQKHSISSSKVRLAVIKAAHQSKKLDEQDLWNEIIGRHCPEQWSEAW